MLAWWNAVPESPPSKVKRREEPERKSRKAAKREAGEELDMPDVEPAFLFLLETLMEAGPTSTAGMGPVPLTWADIGAWEHSTGVELQPWESRLVRILSAEYLAQAQASEKFDCPAPWQPEQTEEKRTRVASHIRDVLRG